MIPWSEVDGTTRYGDPSYPVDLQAHWLELVENGPTMANWVLESPMLELAHERQFVVSQQGGNSVEFEDEHVDRIVRCLSVLDQTFHDAMGWQERPIHALPAVDHIGLWTVNQSLSMPATLDLSETEPTSTANTLPPITLASISTTSLLPPFRRAKTALLPSLIEIPNYDRPDDHGERVQRLRKDFSISTRDGMASPSPRARALKPIRLRKPSSSRTKGISSGGVHKLTDASKLANKFPLVASGHAFDTTTLGFMVTYPGARASCSNATTYDRREAILTTPQPSAAPPTAMDIT